MKHVLFLCLVLAACIANAQVFTTADPNLQIVISGPSTEAQAVEQCINFNLSTASVSQVLASVQETGEHLERVIAEEGWQNSCDGFVKDGQIGVYGQIVREQIMKPAAFSHIKAGDADLSRLCPNYTSMNNSSKANVILLIMTSMAFEESTCNNDKSARGPNGTAKGFFQLHSGRESSYNPDCENYASRTPRGSITCALKMLDKQMSEGNLFRQEENYWDVLRPMRWSKKTKSYFPNPSFAEIRSAISSFEPCTEKQSRQVSDNTTVNKQLFRVVDQKIFHKVITASNE